MKSTKLIYMLKIFRKSLRVKLKEKLFPLEREGLLKELMRWQSCYIDISIWVGYIPAAFFLLASLFLTLENLTPGIW